MKKLTTFSCLFIASLLLSQITTSVITLDLSSPSEKSIIHTGNKKRLVVNNRHPLAFKLINGNPYKYKYVLNYKTINLFSTVTFDPKELAGTDFPLDIDGDRIPDKEDINPEKPDIPSPQVVINEQAKVRTLLESQILIVDTYLKQISNDDILDIDDLKLKQQKYEDEYAKVLKSFNDLQWLYDNLNSNESSVIKAQSEITTLKEELRITIQKLFNTNTSSTYLLPLDLNGDNIDFVEVQLDIYENNITTPVTYTYKIWIRGGLKIDFSGGTFITSLFDRQYLIHSMEDGAKVISESNNGNYDFGFGAVVNISLRGGSWVRPSLNFGALFTSNQKFQMLTGAGFILGKNERFILHTGLSMGQISTIRDGYLADRQTKYNFGENDHVPLKNEFSFGHFFGITYNH